MAVGDELRKSYSSDSDTYNAGVQTRQVSSNDAEALASVITNKKANTKEVAHRSSISSVDTGDISSATGAKDVGNSAHIECHCAFDGIAWSNFQMVVNIGSEGTYDTISAITPHIIKDGSIYKMWYSGSDGTNYRIIYCTSTDGIIWSNFQMVVNIGSEGTYDINGVCTPSVIKDGSIYKMWYTGYDISDVRTTVYCTSTDGIIWSNFQMVVDIGSEGTYDTISAYMPCVIKDDVTYKMWYAGHDGSNTRIIYCTSTDGIIWSNFQMVVNIGSEGTYDTLLTYAPCVVKDDVTYKMWYTGHDVSNTRTIYCTSTDGIIWSNFQMVVNIGSEGIYDSSHIYSPRVINDDGVYKMWYAGHDGTNYRLIYCTSSDGATANGKIVLALFDEADDLIGITEAVYFETQGSWRDGAAGLYVSNRYIFDIGVAAKVRALVSELGTGDAVTIYLEAI